MTKKISRRHFIQLSTSASAGAILATATQSAQSAPIKKVISQSDMLLPKAKGQRVVVIGGGWSGLTIAKYLKSENPNFDVVLIDKRDHFMSCPMSNLWLADVVDLSFLIHSYLDAAKQNQYLFLNATVLDMDREQRIIDTDQGRIRYDYAVIAPGIDYHYPGIGVDDPADQWHLKTHYPAGFMPGSEHLSLKKKLENFKGGLFLLTVPSGNYRCLPAPYERACMMASYFKRNKIKGKILLLDMNQDITIKKEGFHHAFNSLYKNHIDYRPDQLISGVDLGKKSLITEFDQYPFDDAAIYPRIRGAKLIEKLGLVKPGSQFEADIDYFKYHIKGDERVYVTGDARPMPFSKSGNTANTEGHYVAKSIAAHASGKDIPWQSPRTLCYSAVKTDPLESIMVDAHYAYDRKTQSFSFSGVKMVQQWDANYGQANIAWAKGIYHDMLG